LDAHLRPAANRFPYRIAITRNDNAQSLPANRQRLDEGLSSTAFCGRKASLIFILVAVVAVAIHDDLLRQENLPDR
jgi:hypothetical protein